MRRRRLAGLYFVVDPTEPKRAIRVLETALEAGVDIVQVWSAWKDRETFFDPVREMRRIAREYDAPFLVNNDVRMAELVKADGVHMDNYEVGPRQIRKKLGVSSLVGYTTGNDLKRVKWAENAGADYISFCSIFPSASTGECEIVPLETIRKARSFVKIPIFASGGITTSNARSVLEAGTDGVAVISAIQKAKDPESIVKDFKEIIVSLRNERSYPVSFDRRL